MAGESFTPVGRIVKAHGLKGEVSVMEYGGSPFELLMGLDVWMVPPPSGVRAARVTGVRPGPKGPIVALSTVTNIESAKALAGTELLVSESDLPDGWDEEEDEDWALGFAVVDETRGELGTIEETIVTGANDVWVVHGPLGEVLLPVIDELVLEVDEDARTIRVRLLEGLLEPAEDES